MSERQYQSIGGSRGDSDSYGKLTALAFPALAGKRFLDLGCNEGYFCGFALARGAGQVVGVDNDKEFIDRARKRFPEAEFVCSTWDEYNPDEKYDVILLASAIHYADDQPALINRIMSWLSSDGLLVLELGIDETDENKWSTIERHDGYRLYPSRRMLEDVLALYAYKIIGPSVQQIGDPIKRWVVHVRPMRPVVMLLASASYTGKSTLSRLLRGTHNDRTIGIDQILLKLFSRPPNGPLKEFVDECDGKFSPILNGDKIMEAVLSSGLCSDFIDYLFKDSDEEIIVVDGYIPEHLKDNFIKTLEICGYYVWDVQRPRNSTHGVFESPKRIVDIEGRGLVEGWGRMRGAIDRLTLSGTILAGSGWAVFAPTGSPCEEIAVGFRGNVTILTNLIRIQRDDLASRRIAKPGERAGFDFTVDVSMLLGSQRDGNISESDFELFAISGRFEYAVLTRSFANIGQ